MTNKREEVQPSMQFEEWFQEYWGFESNKGMVNSNICYQSVARAAWQAALAAQSVEIERLKKVAELHNDAAVEAWQLTQKWQKRVFELEAAQSAPVDWEKVVREKFPDAWQDAKGSLWSGGLTSRPLGYSWQHAAHHPDVVGGGK